MSRFTHNVKDSLKLPFHARKKGAAFCSKGLYQVNTRILLAELSENLRRPATLADIPDKFYSDLARRYDYVYFLGVWQTGPLSRRVSLDHTSWQAELRSQLPDLAPAQDIAGSPFAVQDYRLHQDFGGSANEDGKGTTGTDLLLQLRERVHAVDMRLILDFVPNHMGLDHEFVQTKPEKMFVLGDEELLAREPQNYVKLKGKDGSDVIIAHGRDPYFDGWPDTIQLNYRHPECRQEMIKQLLRIAKYADGLRCDMAMLLLEDIVQRVWGWRPLPDDAQPVYSSFWLEAVPILRQEHPDFVFIAEVYWDKEWELQQQGFDYTYDKRLYDRLLQKDVNAIRGHLQANLDYQLRSVRFLENHDEPRAAATWPLEPNHRAAAVIAYLLPGLRFFHDGQIEGRKVKVSMHLGRRMKEEVNASLQEFYGRLLDVVLVRPEVSQGEWSLLETREAWEGNWTVQNFIVFAWNSQDKSSRAILVAVNYSPHQSQSYVQISDNSMFADFLHGSLPTVMFNDLLDEENRYERDVDEVLEKGLFLDLRPWQAHVFDVVRSS